ncbi:family 16 glycosylhydrolase [Pararhizobium sp. IMCC21322]|uniref:endo-1,3-1,4-beta-glycanase ExoK n=1 Tax=Pararhizobium sp. IMCC21322 TaxID=3067903 RepID=UPI0027408BD0|nr:family 16 glycosylhydrolase [Pararhizobium sp. IMCC21322]
MDSGDAPENSNKRSDELTETLLACQSRILTLAEQHKGIVELEKLALKMVADVTSSEAAVVSEPAPAAPNASGQNPKPIPENKKVKQVLAAFLIASVTATALTTLSSEPSYADDLDSGVSFVDNFNSLDSIRWYISDGWANGDHQNCTWSKGATGISDDMLVLQFKQQTTADRNYACGEVQTYARFGYGVYEARIKTGSGSGLNAAFFTYIGPVHKKPHDEIDFEFLLKDTSKVQLNYYVGGSGGNEAFIPLEDTSDSGFNNYAFVWEPGQMHWYVNGNLVHQTSDTDVLPSNLQKIYFSLWGSDTFVDWMGPFSAPDEPVLMFVDRVAFTGFDEPCQFDGSVACNFEPAGN